MANATVKWVGSDTFVGIDSSDHSVVLSTSADNVGMKPSELLLVSLASCTAVDVVDILQKKRIDLKSLTIRISGEQDAEPPWTYNKIHLIYTLSGSGLDDKAAEQAIRLSEEKYCSVAATVRGKAEITWEYEIV
ncbi:MAG TPA: OsmC family protein [Longilinea sp.]|nr:OsmC family protein [Longilinea sp.]